MARIFCYNSDGTILSHLTQWDKNVTLAVKGVDISPVPDFHFYNENCESAIPVKPVVEEKELKVKIPNRLLQEGLPITAHIYYVYEDGSARTKYTTTIRVDQRTKPGDYVGPENDLPFLDLSKYIQTVNGVEPDENGNVQIAVISDDALAELMAMLQ